MGEAFESKADRIRREGAEKRARGEYAPDSRQMAKEKARLCIEKAERCVEHGFPIDATWATAFATLAMAHLAIGGVLTPPSSIELL